MLFNSFEFAIFFTVVVILYWLLPNRYRVYFLLLSSYYFYMSWSRNHTLLLTVIIVVNYFGGILLGKTRSDTKRKLVFTSVLIFDLLTIFVFKYYNFFTEPVAEYLDLASMPLHMKLSALSIPAGVSFYTLQAISYVWDVYQKKYEEERNIFSFSTYISSFPQLVAGPIERANNIIPQLKSTKIFNYADARDGLFLMLIGFFKKLVIADQLAIIVNRIFNPSFEYSSFSYVLASVFFVFQIYCDFSGYSDIAIGASKILGIKLSINFKRPLVATSVTEFWRRWHISLSTWINDYLFYNLASSWAKYGKSSIYFALIATFLIVGLWHGANLTFILFGLFHGLALVIEMRNRKNLKKFKKLLPSSVYNTLGAVYNFSFLTFTCIFFRSENVEHALSILEKINPFSKVSSYLFTDLILSLGISLDELVSAIICCAIILIAQLFNVKELRSAVVYEKPVYVRWAAYFILTLVIYRYGVFNKSEFLYFQF